MKMKHVIFSVFTSLLLSLPSLSNADTKNWSYSGETGPEHWASLSPDYALCGSGKNQSPVNIDSQAAIDAESRGIKFNYGLIVPDTIKNTGKNIQISVKAGANIEVEDVEFELKSLAIHIPSENTVNDKHFPMEMQFLHKSKENELAIVSMMFIPGKQDRTLSKLVAQLPMKAGESNGLVANTLRGIEMKKKLANFYRYGGSLTTPPCTEGVSWFIMKQPLTISKDQFQKLKDAMKEDNNRPVQALNARFITE